MSNIIALPPKIYLDTNRLIEISKLRRGVNINYAKSYCFIDNCIINRHFGIIYNPAAPVEWVSGNATLESALQIAGVIDSAKLIYRMLDSDIAIYLNEIFQECKRIDNRIQLPQLDVLQEVQEGSQTTLATQVLKNLGWKNRKRSDDKPIEGLFTSVAYEVEHWFKQKKENPEFDKAGIKGEQYATEKDIILFKRGEKPDLVNWMKRFLRIDNILLAQELGLDIDKFLKIIDIKKCPAD